MFEGVIFDMDGLMFDTERVWARCWEPTLARMGLPMREGIAERARGTAGEEFAAVIHELIGPEVDAQEVWDVWHEVGTEVLLQGVEKKPGLDELLGLLEDEGVPAAVASSSPPELIRHHLERSGIAGHFDVVIASLEVARAKPEPDVFLEAARRLGVSPTRSLVLEDSYNGVRAGAAGGFFTVMVPDLSEPTPEMRRLARRVCSSLLEVRDLLAAGQLG